MDAATPPGACAPPVAATVETADQNKDSAEKSEPGVKPGSDSQSRPAEKRPEEKKPEEKEPPAPGERPMPETPPDPEAHAKPAETGGVVWYYGFQATEIGQQLFKFHSSYRGPNSFQSKTEFDGSQSYTLYLGVRPSPHLAFYVNPEWGIGRGVSRSVGLAGYVNGDILASPPVSQEPYLARYFVRWIMHAGPGFTKQDPSVNNVGGEVPAHRIVVTAGKLVTTDIFDLNSYAANPRTQFFNWTLDSNGAYDYAGDLRGYTHGLAIEWLHPDWALRVGSFQMPRTAGGPNLSWDLWNSHGDQLEAEFHPVFLGPHSTPMVVRLLAYRNTADMGDYAAALRKGKQTGSTPDIRLTREEGAVKYGFGLNLERPLADKAATGVFLRLGWNEGRKEDFAFTEADRTLSLGGQISGVHWRRENDVIGVGLCFNGLSGVHKRYLEAGGTGFQLGDGRLNYGTEQILETYYSYKVNKYLSVTGDYQLINHPGYNRDRGPISLLSARVHLKF